MNGMCLVILILLAGCSATPADPENEFRAPDGLLAPHTISFVIEPGTLDLIPGETVRLVAYLVDEEGYGRPVRARWYSDNAKVARITDNGRVTAVSAGSTSIRAILVKEAGAVADVEYDAAKAFITVR
jgi:uncharacterized protein YjdB